jgi:hypothetical protein
MGANVDLTVTGTVVTTREQPPSAPRPSHLSRRQRASGSAAQPSRPAQSAFPPTGSGSAREEVDHQFHGDALTPVHVASRWQAAGVTDKRPARQATALAEEHFRWKRDRVALATAALSVGRPDRHVDRCAERPRRGVHLIISEAPVRRFLVVTARRLAAGHRAKRLPEPAPAGRRDARSLARASAKYTGREATSWSCTARTARQM